MAELYSSQPTTWKTEEKNKIVISRILESRSYELEMD